MTVKASVIEELRSMFKEGATPSRLIQHIVARHPDEQRNWHGLIQDYFREGFTVPIVRGLSPSESYGDINLQYAHLNEDLLHDMVQSRPTWDQGRTKSEDELPCWLDSLTATSPLDRLHQAQQMGPPLDLSESWNGLSEAERRAIQLTNAGYKGRTEMVRVLARLVERLQQRIVALEEQQSEPVEASTR